ncbi:FecR family protein [Sunxiuqinia sp. sy24]|uniref:FecR family protein n=1 Tax=Sunxiuqinia sp. sy24 TaxID=3461495 RepID=UPI0040462EAA
MKKEIDSKILSRYLNGSYSPDDYRQLKSWFEKEGTAEPLDTLIHQNWQQFNEQHPGKDLDFILEKVQRQIYLNEKRQTKSLWHTYRQIAAVLLLPFLLLTTYLLLNNKYIPENAWAEIHSPAGARTQFQLPDGTSGWLNSGSSIQYPIKFSNRHVKISGEAFFDVVKQNKEKFVVETPYLNITVLGTKFNVAAYPNDQFAEVVLEEGKVNVDGKTSKFSESLSPDERFVFETDLKVGKITHVDAQSHSAWKEGKLVFHDQPLAEVLKKMERWYNVQFVMKDEQLKNYIYKGTFINETLDEVLKLLAYTAPISYEIKDRKMKSDGTWSTKTILIQKRR